MGLRKLGLAGCVICFLASPARAKESVADSLTLPWVKGLPEATETDKGLLLPPAAANEVARHLEWEAKLPQVCAEHIDRERARAEAAEKFKGVPTWLFITGAMGGVLAGIITGLVLE